MAEYLTYWTSDPVNGELGMELRHAANNQFRARGVGPDDRVYVVNWKNGTLYLVGRMIVDQVVDRAAAERIVGTTDLWPADDHVVARPGTATTVKMRELTEQQLRSVEFVTETGTAGPKLRRDGEVDHQTFRVTREISRSTAQMFEDILQQDP